MSKRLHFILLLLDIMLSCAVESSTSGKGRNPSNRGDVVDNTDSTSQLIKATSNHISSNEWNCKCSDDMTTLTSNGKDTYIFDQKMRPSDHLTDINCEIMTAWSDVSTQIFNKSLQRSSSCLQIFQTERVLRFVFLVERLNDTTPLRYQEILQYYNNPENPLPNMLQRPIAITESCTPSYKCGDNAVCSNILNKKKCRCVEGYKGNPEQKCFGFCNAQIINDHHFPGSWQGAIALSNQSCPEGYFGASAVCTAIERNIRQTNFKFKMFRRINCGKTIESVIAQASKSGISVSKFDDYSAYLQVLTASQSQFSTQQASEVLSFLQNILNRRSLLTTDTSLRSLATVAYQLAPKAENLSMRLAQLLPKMVLQSAFANNQTKFSFDTELFALQTTELNETGNFSIDHSPVLRTTSSGNSSFQPISLHVPTSVLDRARIQQRNASQPTNGLRTAFLYYRKNDLFTDDASVFNILSVDIGDNVSLTDLDEPVIITHSNVDAKHGRSSSLSTVHLMINKTTIRCVYWNFTSSDWSSEGCCLNTSSSRPTCQCSHLTNFALIVKSENVPANFVLGIVSLVGCALSIIGLVITIFVMAAKRDLRKHRGSKVLLHICCNLLVVYVVFVAGAARAVGHHVGCAIVTALLHYFLLTSWCWMAVYSFEMYNSLVKVFVRYKSGFMQKSNLFCYLVPAVVVATTAGIATGVYGKSTHNKEICGANEDLAESLYHAENVCWLKGFSLYLGFLLPVGLLLTYNFVVFAIVTVELNRHNNVSEHLKRTTKDSFLISATMTVLVGLTWIFGYILLVSTDPTFYVIMSWLFAIFNTLQGFGIFLLTTLRKKDMRSVWWSPIMRVFKQKKSQQSQYPHHTASKSTISVLNDRKHTTKSQFITSEDCL